MQLTLGTAEISMINVGVIGLGMMGVTHLGVYAEQKDVQIVAVSDLDPDRLSGLSVAGANIEGLPEGSVLSNDVKRYENASDLIVDPHVQIVDICLPTPLHLQYAKFALASGKHVMVEKPLARNSAEAFEIAESADRAPGFGMPAMCMRFWPGWNWLKQAIDTQAYGKVFSAHFRRVLAHPGGPFYSDGKACGGAILDLHVHDADFIQFCFGVPGAVFSRGYSKISGEIDHVTTQYLFDEVPIVTAEGGWAMSDGFSLEMQYTVNFEHAMAKFEFTDTNQLILFRAGNGREL
jgi:predicted dehydrogenase